MRNIIANMISLFVISFVAVSALLPDAGHLNQAAFGVAWAATIIPFVVIAFSFWLAFRPGNDPVNDLRDIANETESEILSAAKILLLLTAILLNGWWLTAAAYLSFELSCFILLKSMRLFVAKADADAAEQVTVAEMQKKARHFVRSQQAEGRSRRVSNDMSDPLHPLNPLNPLSPFNPAHSIEDGGRHLSGNVSSSYTSHGSHGGYDSSDSSSSSCDSGSSSSSSCD